MDTHHPEQNNEELRAWLVALRSKEPLDRCDAAESPPESATPEQVAVALAPLLDDEHELVRLSAAEALGACPHPEARDALRAFVARETDEMALAHGLSSLGLVGDARDIEVFLRQASAQTGPHVAIHSRVGLYELIRRLVKDSLAGYLDDEHPEIRVLAAEALGSVVQERDDADTLRAIEARVAGESVAGVRNDLRAVIESVWGARPPDPDGD